MSMYNNESDPSQNRDEPLYDGMPAHEFIAIFQKMQADIDNHAPHILTILATFPDFINWVEEKLLMAIIIEATEPLSILKQEERGGKIYYGWEIPKVKEIKFNKRAN